MGQPRTRARAAGRLGSARGALPAVVAGALLLWLAFDGGAFSLSARVAAGLAAWWGVLVAVALAPAGARVGRVSLTAGLFFAAFTLWTGLSLVWTPDTEATLEEFGRVLVYLAVFVLAAFVVPRRAFASVADGVAFGIGVTGAAALATRLFPGLVSNRVTLTFLHGSLARLAYPLNYWNGLSIFVAIGIVLLLRAATTRPPAVAAAAVGVVPALGCTMYLTSSRGGFAALALGTLVFLVCTADRWRAAAAVLVAAAGAAVGIAVLTRYHRLVDGPFDTAATRSDGRTAAILIAVVCVVAGLVVAGALALAPRLPPPSRAFSAGAVAAAVVALVVAVVLAHPIRRFEAFKAPPSATGGPRLVQQHLLGGNGTGRWQLWAAAVHEADGHVLTGRGAGTYQEWWAEHGSLPLFVEDAHSLYAETLGELGVVGLVLLLTSFAVAVVGALVRIRAHPARATVAGLLGAFTAYAVGAGVDWMWELTVVSLAGVALLGMLAAAGDDPRPVERRRLPALARAGMAATATAAAVCILVPWLAERRIDASEHAAAADRPAAAYRGALAARTIEPWAATPYLQAALVAEQAGDLGTARRMLPKAISRDRFNWALWYVQARVLHESGLDRSARRSLARAVALNPRSPVLANVRLSSL